ncbi:MAG: RluA family pseudouridine synthase [Actinomycetota bacterium]
MAELVAAPGRLDAVVARLSGAPRADVQRAIAAGAVTVDGAVRPKSFRLAGGERLVVDLPGQEPLAAELEPVPVRFRDEHLLVIAKPAGLVTHPTARRRTGTLVNRLLGMGVPLAPAGGPLRPGIVHRLDAGTSGLMVVAETDAAFEALQAMLRRHAVQRRYLALVRGAPANDVFGVEAPLGRRADRIVVDHVEGRAAATGFEVRERLPRAALLEAAPRTGRTHQIRVHLAAVGHPILGDRAYGGAGDEARRIGLARPFLHSWRLAFDHPITGERVALEEPLPTDLANALERARHDLRP